jgi:hypothetical protein
MSENRKSEQDLIFIFARIYLFIKRYFIIFILFLIFGVSYGYYKSSSSGYFFKKHLVISSIVVEKEISFEIIKSVLMLLEENNTSGLSQKLRIPVNAASSIMKIDTGSFHNKKNIGFVLDLSIRDSSYADTITAGLLNFMNNNKYYLKNVELFVKGKQEILQTINNKLKIIDSTHENSNSIYSSIRGENSILVKSSSSEQIRLLEEKNRLETDIEFGSKISVVDESMGRFFSGMSLGKSIILNGMGMFIIGLLISVFLELVRLTRKYLKQK